MLTSFIVVIMLVLFLIPATMLLTSLLVRYMTCENLRNIMFLTITNMVISFFLFIISIILGIIYYTKNNCKTHVALIFVFCLVLLGLQVAIITITFVTLRKNKCLRVETCSSITFDEYAEGDSVSDSDSIHSNTSKVTLIGLSAGNVLLIVITIFIAVNFLRKDKV